MEVAGRVGFRVWLRNVAHVETSALVRCRGGFANTLDDHFSGRLQRIALRSRRKTHK